MDLKQIEQFNKKYLTTVLPEIGKKINFESLPELKHKIQKEIKKIELLLTQCLQTNNFENLMINFSKLLSEFSNFQLSVIAFSDQISGRYRIFKSKMDEMQEYLYKNILFSFRIIDNIIIIWTEIVEKMNNPHNFPNDEKNLYQIITKSIIQLAGSSHFFLCKLEYCTPLVTNLSPKIHFGFVCSIMDYQIRIFKSLEAACVAKVPWAYLDYRSLTGRFAYINKDLSPRDIIKCYEKDRNELLELMTKNLEKLYQICFFRHKYSEITLPSHQTDSKSMTEFFLSLEEDITLAEKIDPFLTFCVYKAYLGLQMGDIKYDYYQLIKKEIKILTSHQNKIEKNQTIEKFIEKINLFVSTTNRMWDSLNHNHQPEEIGLIYDKLIAFDYHFMEIALSQNQVFYLLSFFINDLAIFSHYSNVIADLQKKQLELLKCEQAFLATLALKNNVSLPRWCLTEGEDIKIIDVNLENDQKESKNGRQKKHILAGFDIIDILQIQNKLSMSLSGHQKIKLHGFTQQDDYKKIIDESNNAYIQIMEEEEQAEKNKKNILLEKKKIKSPYRHSKEKIQEKTQTEFLIPKKQTEVKVIAESEEWKQFHLLQKDFSRLVEEKGDEEVKNRSGSLFETNDLLLLIQLNDFMSGYLYVTAKDLYNQKIVNFYVIYRLQMALSYRKISMNQLNLLPEKESYQTHQYFLEDEHKMIETILNNAEITRKKSLDKAIASLQWLQEDRLRKMTEIGLEKWFNNPNPKNDWFHRREKLKDKIRNLSLLDQEIVETKKILDSVSMDAYNPFGKMLNQKTPSILVHNHSLLDEKISSGIIKFKNTIQKIILDRMKFYSIVKKPDNFFPTPILLSAFKFMVLIKNSFGSEKQLYIVGGLIVNLAQERKVSEQTFNFLDVDMVTNISYNELKSAAFQNKLNYKITSVTPLFCSFKFRFENVNIDVVCINDLDLLENHQLRDININGIYLRINKESDLSIVNEALFYDVIDACLLRVNKPGLIRSCTGHLEKNSIKEIIPLWNELCIRYPLDSVVFEKTLKCFIDDPTRLLRVCFMLKKQMIKFEDFDDAMRLCFNQSEQKILLPLIFQSHSLLKKISCVIIFDKFINYTIKKATQATDCLHINPADLLGIYSTMMSWCFSETYFSEIFSFPLKMETPTMQQANIEQACKRLFLPSFFEPPIYNFLRKKLIEIYTSIVRPELEIRLLPFILALIISNQPNAFENIEFSGLISLICKHVRDIPGLNNLYGELPKNEKLPNVKQTLNHFFRQIKENSEEVKSLSLTSP